MLWTLSDTVTTRSCNPCLTRKGENGREGGVEGAGEGHGRQCLARSSEHERHEQGEQSLCVEQHAPLSYFTANVRMVARRFTNAVVS